MMDYRITLAPRGDLRLVLPSGRYLDFTESVAGLRTLKKVLRNARDYDGNPARGHIGEFPTQAIVNAWIAADTAAKEERALALAEEEAEAIKKDFAEKGIDVEALKFTL